MTYNSERGHTYQPDPRRVADAMRRFFHNKRGGYQGDGYGGGYDSKRDNGYSYNYSERPGYNPANPYEENGRYEQQPSMGFDPYQNSHHNQPQHHEYGKPHREYQREEKEFDLRMEDYFRRINEGRTNVPESLCEVVASGVAAYMGNSENGSRNEWQDGDDETSHMRYKEAVERIRDATSMQEKEKLMKELFGENLSPDEQVVLRDMAMSKSYKQKAREKWGNGAGWERWLDAKKALRNTYKHKQSA